MEVAIFILAVLVLVIIVVYNNLIRKKNAVDNAFFSIDIMLKKRYDLIPQLIEMVKGYMTHEKEVLLGLTALRQKATDNSLSVNEKVGIDNQINTALGNLFVSFENYPQLKANENFLHLQGAINEAEEQLAASRRFYNAAVNAYHNAIETFPSSMLASWKGMQHKSYFHMPDSEKEVQLIN